MCIHDELIIRIPETNICLKPGCFIRIGRFSKILWLLQYGWFEFSNNREICGWYLINDKDPHDVRPLQRNDLIDIYTVER